MFVKLIDGNPNLYSENDLRRDNPNTSFPNGLSDQIKADYGLMPFERTPAPAHDPEVEKLSREGFVEVGGVWRDNWIKTPLTAKEIAANAQVEKTETEAQFDKPSGLTRVQLKIAFIHENRLRALEGKQPITAEQFRTWVRGQID